MTSQEHFKDQFKKEKSHDKEYKGFTMKKAIQKSFLKANAPLPIVRECQRYLPSFGGALQHSVPHSGGALSCLRKSWVVEENQGKILLISGVSWIRI
jgi:hypothetical protein